MTIPEFNKLDDQSKRVVIFDADKIADREDDYTKFELFIIDDFFIEVKISRLNNFKRLFTTYTLAELPLNYTDVYLHFLNDKLKRII